MGARSANTAQQPVVDRFALGNTHSPTRTSKEARTNFYASSVRVYVCVFVSPPKCPSSAAFSFPAISTVEKECTSA